MSAVHGLQLAPDDSQVVLERPAPHAPIKTINAHQLARLLHQYNTADVDDSILFPFLHGLEGSNVAQNMFFSQARKRMDRPKVPRYRGLALVRVDEQGLELDARGNVRHPPTNCMDSQIMHKGPCGDGEYEEDDDDDSDSDAGRSAEDDQAMSVDAHQDGAHMHPVAERHPHPPPLKTNGALKSSSGASAGSSASSESMDNYFPSPTHSTFSITQTSPPTTPNSTIDGAPKTSFGSFTVDLSVDPSLPSGTLPPRDSTPIPEAERRPSHILVSSLHPDEILTCTPSGPVFLNPKIPEGISLRNFGIQVPIYATLSDIVVYSPKGRTRAALELAEKFKQAVESKAVERGLVRPGSPNSGTPALMSPDGIVYNVYICTDSFEVFEKQYPHLVAIDSQGNLVHKTDLMEREKEEMRNLTKASEIADGVYLGNTGDVPMHAEPQIPVVATPMVPSQRRAKSNAEVCYEFDTPSQDNLAGYDICIECHDMASFPTFAQLRAVEDRIRGMEEAWKQRVRQKEEREAEDAARRKSLEERESKRQKESKDDGMEIDTPEYHANTTSSPSSGSDADVESSSVKVLDGGLGLALDMPPLLPPAIPPKPSNSPLSSGEPTPMPSPPIIAATQQEPFAPSPRTSLSTAPSAYGGSSHPYRGHARSRSLTSPKPLALNGSLPVRHHHHHHKARIAAAVSSVPPRPPPPASHIIHLSFPSSPPATPGTLTSMIPFLHFLQSLAQPKATSVLAEEMAPPSSPPARVGSTGSLGRARSPSTGNVNGAGAAMAAVSNGRTSSGTPGSLSGLAPRTRSQSLLIAGGVGMPMRSATGLNGKGATQTQLLPQLQLSRPLKILMHAGDGYTETSVLALSYLMLTGNKSLPEAYLELQVQRHRSFFVYSPDVGVLRRVEQRLKMDREREREKMAASIAATAASVTAASARRTAPSSYKPARPSSASSNSSSSSSSSSRSPATPSSTSSPPSSPNGGGSKWRWGGLPTSWKSGSLSGAGVSFLNGAGMFASLGSNSSNPTVPPPAASAGVPSIATEEARQAMFTPPLEDVGPFDRSFHSPTPPLTPASSCPIPVLASPISETPDLEAPAPLPSSTHNHRMLPSQRPSSLSQSYVTGQGPAFQHNPVRRARASTSPLLPSFVDHETWFNDPKFEGSFPSRVLPFLYLGNLAHAANAYMLHALGITHVVSVGECALIPPPSHTPQSTVTYTQNQSGGYQVTAGSGLGGPGHGTASGFIPGRPGTGSLWVEEKEGRIKVLDIKGVCDDGIDSLRPQIAPTVEWIDKARAEGGKILIHCRVGVSRSATVTIAYVMHHLNVSLVDAYLMVRSRRLSVLIQPNMRLLYNLCGWEIELARRRAESEHRELVFGEGRRLSWPYLAREVHILNERYLS